MSRNNEARELDKLRKTIDEFRAKAQTNKGVKTSTSNSNMTLQLRHNITGPMGYPSSDTNVWRVPPSYATHLRSSGKHYNTLSTNPNRISTGSCSSMSSSTSHSSVSSSGSCSSADSGQKKDKKKRWLPLKSSSSRSSTSSRSSGDQELNDVDNAECFFSPTSSRHDVYTSSLDAGLDKQEINPEAYNEMLQVVQEKERKLTDVRLEALMSQHQLHQLQDKVLQMQHEMQRLRLENERLQASNANINSSDSSLANNLDLNAIPPFNIPGSAELLSADSRSFYDEKEACKDLTNLHQLRCENSCEGTPIRFVVSSMTTLTMKAQDCHLAEIPIGIIPVARQCTWEELDRKAENILMNYCGWIDEENKLNMTSSSIAFYKVGEQSRVPGTQPPELLPCAFLIGDVDVIEISLRDASCNSVDLLAFKTLIPKKILRSYINEILQTGKVILHGPSGTGKSFLSRSLANHLVAREQRKFNKDEAVFVYDVKQMGEEMLNNYLKELANKYRESTTSMTLPYVIIVENCHLLTSFFDTFSLLLGQNSNRPYIIVSTLQGQIRDNENYKHRFSWISCSNKSLHVQSYLARCLRRQVAENMLCRQQEIDDEFQSILSVIQWLPLCWRHVNKCLEKHGAIDVTIGPRIFTSCPVNYHTSCSWFMHVWNQVLAPYIKAAIEKINQSQQLNYRSNKLDWADPREWIVKSFPWNVDNMGCDIIYLEHIINDDVNSSLPNTARDLTCQMSSNQRTRRKTQKNFENLANDWKMENFQGFPNTLSRHNNEQYPDVPIPSMRLLDTGDRTATLTRKSFMS